MRWIVHSPLPGSGIIRPMGLVNTANASANVRSRKALEQANVIAADRNKLLEELLVEQRNTNRWLAHIAGLLAAKEAPDAG